MTALFGPAGNCDKFYDEGNKSSLQAPEFIKKMGLSIYEYQCGKGVKISKETAEALGNKAKESEIILTVHAPYYISLSSAEEEKRQNSVRYIMDTLAAAKHMNAVRIVVHSGSCAKMSREAAVELAKQTLKAALDEADGAGFGDIYICPETMGKINQLGTVEEVVELCKIDERLIPTIDFGHVNARSQGGLKSIEDFYYIFDCIANNLGEYRAKHFHAHYSRIEFTQGGEKMHHCFSDTQYGPDFHPIAQIIAERNLSPIIICESRGTQTSDAKEMQEIYRSYCKD